MKIAALQKLTLLDYPGKVACILFLPGCNLRCPFCHNTGLLSLQETVDEAEVLTYLTQRMGLLEGVVISGGEPMLHPELPDLLRKIKSLGYSIKLDTNGTFPAPLRRLVEEHLVDYVAMDIKNSPGKYELTTSKADLLSRVRESVDYLKSDVVDYEFRTTVVHELHQLEDFDTIGRWIQGCKRYFLQSFVDSGYILTEGLNPPSPQFMEEAKRILSQYVPNTVVR